MLNTKSCMKINNAIFSQELQNKQNKQKRLKRINKKNDLKNKQKAVNHNDFKL